MILHPRNSDRAQVVLKRYAAGKVIASSFGDPEYAVRADAALQRSVIVEAKIDVDRFLGLMRAAGVPDEVSADFLAECELVDEAWLQDVMPR